MGNRIFKICSCGDVNPNTGEAFLVIIIKRKKSFKSLFNTKNF